MDIRIQIKNLAQVKEGLAKAPQVFAKHVDQAIKRSIYIIERTAKPLTPVDTGRLKGSYETIFQPLRGILDVNTNYAFFQEFGTYKMEAQPFLTPGIDQSIGDINQEFETAVEKSLEEIASKTQTI